MFERTHYYPMAITAGPEHGDRGLQDGLRWLAMKANELGGEPLIFAPTKASIGDVPLLEQFASLPGVAVGTWRSDGWTWSGGPVLAAWPSREKLGQIADHRRTAALCVVPSSSDKVVAWQVAVGPELLGPATAPPGALSLEPVVVEGLVDLTAMVNHSNNLAGSLDRRDAVAVLRTLNDAGYRLPPLAVYSWSIAHGWPARGAERLRQLAADIEAGKRPRLTGAFPLRADAIERWRARARGAERP